MSRPEAPLDLVLVSDLGTGDRTGALASRADRPILVEADDCGALPGKLGANLPALGLRFSSLRDFRPEGLAEQLPSMRGLLEIQRLAGEVRAGRTGFDALRAAAAASGITVDAAPAEPATPKPDAESRRPPAEPQGVRPPGQGEAEGHAPGKDGSLFDLIDLDGSQPGAAGGEVDARSTAKRELNRLLGSLIGSSGPDRPPSPAALTALEEAADREIERHLHGVLRHPGFRALESAWFGLRFLCRRIDFRSGVRLYTLPAARGDLPRRLRDALAPFIEERQAESRVVCVLLDFPFDAGGEDLALLASIGGAAAAWRVPVIAPLDPARLAADPDDPVADVRSEWERFRQADEAEWVALAANRFLLRMPYGASGEVVRGFRFEEAVATRKDLLWGGAHWLVGALVARSFAMTGWGADLTGARTGGLIEDLPVAEIRTERGERTTSPLEHLPNEAAALRWIRHGLVAVAGRRDTDQALLVGSPVAHGSEQTLTQRLFEAQVQAMGRSIGAHTDARRPAEEIASTLAAGLNFLASGPDGPLFRATVEGGADGALLRITPERPPLRGLDSFVIRIQRS